MRISLTVTAGPSKNQSFTFEEPDCFLFGRAADARVSLPHDPYVSREHFLLEIAPPNCRVNDLDSKNGTFVNDLRYGGRKPPLPSVKQAPGGAKATLLGHGDEISVGDTRMTVTIELDALCMNCGNDIPDELRSELTLEGDTFLCGDCRARRAANAKTGNLTLTQRATPQRRAVRCIRCNGDVTDEAGVRGQRKDAEYVCKACRDKEKADPNALLDQVLGIERAEPALPGAPSIPGYRIDKVLGRGGMGMVYQATQRGTGRVVAIKTMLPEVAVDEHAARMFRREVDITRQLKHPNIVELLEHGRLDCGPTKGTFYFVLEFVEGMDLEKFFERKKGPVDLQVAAPLMMGILAGLGHAHRAAVETPPVGAEKKSFVGVVHRDLKPPNILLGRSPQGFVPKVADFGLAKSFESAGLTDMTRPGQICGSFIYWPREQLTHYKYLTPSTDVFSIAAVFYQMLTGDLMRQGFHELFAQCERRNCGINMAEIMNVICNNPIKPLRSQNPSIPKPVANVIDRAVREAEVASDEAKVRAELAKLRYPDAADFAEALGQALKKVGVPT